MSKSIPPLLRHLLDDAKLPRVREEIEAGGHFLLGQSTLRDYLTALNKVKTVTPTRRPHGR